MVAEGCVGASRRRAESWRTVGAHQELPVRPSLPPTRPRVPRVPHADGVARLRKQTKLKVIVALMTDKVQRGLEKRIQRVFAVKRTSKHPGVAKGRRGPPGSFQGRQISDEGVCTRISEADLSVVCSWNPFARRPGRAPGWRRLRWGAGLVSAGRGRCRRHRALQPICIRWRSFGRDASPVILREWYCPGFRCAIAGYLLSVSESDCKAGPSPALCLRGQGRDFLESRVFSE